VLGMLDNGCQLGIKTRAEKAFKKSVRQLHGSHRIRPHNTSSSVEVRREEPKSVMG
jgi:hypothetical protein